jgi:hypothetical protein
MSLSDSDFQKLIEQAKLRVPSADMLVIRRNLNILMQKVIYIDSIESAANSAKHK